jgi:hypothetical protein
MIKDSIDEYVKTLKKEWSHDRTKTVGGSEIGQCARRVYYTKNNEVGEDQSKNYGAAIRGTMMEDQFWEPALRNRFKDNFLFSGKNQKTLAKGYLSATPDGLLINQPRNFLSGFGIEDMGSDCIITESKSLDPRVTISKEKEEHNYQVQVQLGLMRELTEYKPEYALISYIDASFWHNIVEFPVKFDEKIYETAHARAAEILNAKHPSELRPEGWIAGGKDCDYCPFVAQCNIERKTIPTVETTVEPQFVSEIEDLCRDFLSAKDAAEAADADVKLAQEKIKQRLRDHNVRKIPGLVSWSLQKGRESYDYKSLKAAAEKAGVEIDKFMTVGEPTDRLTVILKS